MEKEPKIHKEDEEEEEEEESGATVKKARPTT